MNIRCFLVEADGNGNFLRNNDGWRPMGEMPIGAMYYADWYPRKGPDGHHLIAKTPGGLWHVDGRASNCTLPNDDVHRCWVRHGVPPDVTVDKNGQTCGCGCSIGQRGFHGFLRHGELVAV